MVLITDNKLREKLLGEADLNLNKCIDLCHAALITLNRTKEIESDAPVQVDKIHKKEKERVKRNDKKPSTSSKNDGTIHKKDYKSVYQMWKFAQDK